MAVRLQEIKNQRAESQSRAIRSRLFSGVRAIIGDLDSELAGYAVVAWDRHGALRSVYEAAGGPIGANLVPTLCADALNRHLASEIDHPAGIGAVD